MTTSERSSKAICLPSNGRVFIITGVNGSGKTRALSGIAYRTLEEMKNGTSKVSKLICLSGTIIDKFPGPKERAANYEYFGRKTNTNMFSEITPYRSLLRHLAMTDQFYQKREEAAQKYLQNIGLGDIIVFKLRRGRKASEREEITREQLNLSVSLLNRDNLADIIKALKRIENGLMHISGVSLMKGNNLLDISDLSSGERAYALAILSLAFSSAENCLILYDEPENSLHPTWQRSIISNIHDMLNSIFPLFKLAVATHSPLVAASVRNSDSYLLDLQSDGEWRQSDLHGNSSDTVLRSQFKIDSPRSSLFVMLLQKCLNEIASSSGESKSFAESADKLLALNAIISDEDPLHGAYQRIKELRERMKS